MKFVRKSETIWIIGVFLSWRISLFLVSFVAQKFLPFKKSFPYADTILIPSGLPSWLWAWSGFDGVHYLTIAKSGYDGFGTQVFFPLYPMFINLINRLVPNILISGLLISNLSILLAAMVLYKMTKNKWAVAFLFAFPFSFYFGSVYTESLFLLLVLLTFSYSKVFSFLAGATRLAGIFLAPWGWAGLVLYSLYLWWRFGRPLFFLSAQSAFGSRATTLTTLVTPFQTLFRYGKIFLTVSPANYNFWIAFSEISTFVFAIGMLIWLTKKIPISWLVFSWLSLLLPSFSGTLSSMPRYLLGIFPIFVGLGLIKNPLIKSGIIFLFVILLVIFTALFTRGYWVS